LVACNPAFARILGIPRQGVQARVHLLDLLQDQQVVDKLLEKIRKEGRILDQEFQTERADGRPLHLQATIVGNFDAGGALTEIKGYVLDATERWNLEEQLRQSQKMEAIGQLAGGVAHDFNNILTAIITCSELLVEDPEATPKAKRYGGEIRSAGERAASLTRQLLAFSRRQVVKPQNMDFNQVISSMEEMLRRIIGEHIQLSLSLSCESLRVHADPAQIEQVLMNLSVNARDAMPQGGQLSIETALVVLDQEYAQHHVDVQPGEHVCLTVRDTGVGIPPKFQSHIFEPFFTTKGLGRGTGLGLSTVYGIVRQSNGHIALVSEVDQGTAFHVYLPRIKTNIELQEDPRPASSAPFGGGETILMAEDDDSVRALTRQILERAGYRVLEAPGGPEALRLSAQESTPIDMLLTDAVMPGMNGRELADRIMAQRPGIKVLFMSGYTDDILGELGGALKGVELLDKPFSSAALTHRVRLILDSLKKV
jgi:PAS domain S-box-containing protein